MSGDEISQPMPWFDLLARADQSKREQILDLWIAEEVLPQANELITAHHGKALDQIAIAWNLRGRTAGMVVRKRQQLAVRLNRALWSLDQPVDHVMETVLHEIAHVCVFRVDPKAPPHGALWQHFARSLGITPSRCHTLPLRRARRSREFCYATEAGDIWLGAVRHGRLQRRERRYFMVRNSRTEIRPDQYTGRMRVKR